MSYSDSITEIVTCPSCQKTYTDETWRIIDSLERPDLIDGLLAEEFKSLICPHCNSATPKPEETLLLVFREQKIVLVIPPTGANLEESFVQAEPYFEILAKKELPDMDSYEVSGVPREELSHIIGVGHDADTCNCGDTSEHHALIHQLQELLNASTLDDIKAILEKNSLLLGEEADAILQKFQEQTSEDEQDERDYIQQYRELLKSCRNKGIAATFEEVDMDGGDVIDEQVKLIAKYLQAQSLDESRQILLENPSLLDDETDEFLDMLIRSMSDEQKGERNTLQRYQAILRRCNEIGVIEAYREIEKQTEK